MSLADGQTIAAGTMIDTPDGPWPVESLSVGALVLTATGAVRRVQWATQSLAEPGVACLIAAHAFGRGRPAAEVVVGGQTRIGIAPGLAAVAAQSICDGEAVRPYPDAAAMVALDLDAPGSLVIEGLPVAVSADPAPAGLVALAEAQAVAALALGRGLRPGPLGGNLDRATAEGVTGWAFDPENPASRVPLILRCNGVLRAGAIAAQFRVDLQEAGKGDGCVAFRIALVPPLPEDRPHILEVCRATDGVALPGSPMLLLPGAAGLPVAVYPGMSDEERARIAGLLQAQIDLLLSA